VIAGIGQFPAQHIPDVRFVVGNQESYHVMNRRSNTLWPYSSRIEEGSSA
jgi:hypothetical protein